MKIFITVLLLLTVLAFATPDVQSLSSNLNMTITSQEPFPAEPGKNMDIEVEIQNNGAGEASTIVLGVVGREPFSLLPGEASTREFNLVQAQSSVKTTYRFHVDAAAVSGTYELEFTIGFPGGLSKTQTLSVTVQGQPRLIVESLGISPEKLEAGGRASLTTFLKNVGTGTARHLILTLNATPEIIPLLSKGSVYLGNVEPSAQVAAVMELSVDSLAEEKTYTIQLGADYQDESNSDNTKTFSIGIPVSGTVKLDIITIEPDYGRQMLDIEVANKGTTEAKSVEAHLLSGSELIGVDYISKIKPNKKTTFTFPLLPAEGKETLEIAYIGPGLDESNITKTIIFDIGGNGSGGNTGTFAVVVIIIVAAGFYWWRRKKK